MKIHFDDESYDLEPGETVLSCLERNGVEVTSFCRGGTCQTCVLRAAAGDVPSASQVGLRPAWKEQGIFLSCICRPTEELAIERARVTQSYPAEILRVDRLSRSVVRLWLGRPRGFDYQAGQYVQVVRPQDGVMRPYSLASVPGQDELEMHVAVLPNGALSPWLANGQGRVVEIRGPLGECVYVRGDSRRPLLLAGTGTGVAPLLGVIREALAVGHAGPIRLFHGSQSLEGLYLRRELDALAATVDNLQVTYSVLDPAAAGSEASVSSVPLEDLVMAQGDDLEKRMTYLCGDPELVTALRKKLNRAGALLPNILVDPFTAPGSAR